MYRSATESYVLILYPATLWNSLMVLIIFLVKSLRCSIYNKSCHLQIVRVILLSYQFACLLFIFLVWLLWLGPPVLMLNENGESGYPCLVPVLRRKTFSFLPLSMMLAVGLSFVHFIMLRLFPLYQLCWEFLS